MRTFLTKNRIQNLLIAALTASALFLLAQTQFLAQSSGGLLSALFSPPAAAQGSGAAEDLSAASFPVWLAVTGTYGRYGDLSLTTGDEAFAAPAALLREALGSADGAQPCTEEEWRLALEELSVCYDFTASLPLPVVAGLVGAAAAGASDLSARRLLLAAEGESVSLLTADADGYRRCATKVARRTLETVVNGCQLGNAGFAFETEGADALAPYTLLLTGGQPDMPVLQASNPLGDPEALLSALGFNPYTNSRYTEVSGTVVIVDGERKLWLQTNGMIRYEDGGEGRALHLGAAEGKLTAAEAAAGCSALLSDLLQSAGSGAGLCLQRVAATETGWTLAFDYHSGGTLIRRSDGAPAAEVTLAGTGIQSLSLLARSYAETEQPSLLLPLAQALAVAQAYPGAEMRVCYTDSLTGTVSAGWLAE